MTPSRRFTALFIPLFALGAAACGERAESPAPGSGTAESPAADTTGATPVPQIASGTVQVPPTTAAGESAGGAARPTPEGRRRTVPIEEAVGAIPFTLLEPTLLPEGADRGGTVHLIEPYEGQAADYLPAVRMIYDIESGGSLVILESPARGVTIEGADVATIDGRDVYVESDGEQLILTWEQDGINIQMRGLHLSRARMEEIAASFAPLGTQPAESAGDAAQPAAPSGDDAAAPSPGADEATPTSEG